MKPSSYTLYDLRNSLSGLLGLAFRERFPHGLLAGAKVSPTGFYCDFSFDEDFSPENLRQLEEVIESWVRQKLPLIGKEMVPLSAREYFLFHRQPLLAEKVDESSDSTFFFLQLFDFMTLVEAPVLIPNLGHVGAFKLQKSERIGSLLRIYGTAFFDKAEMKEFLKKLEGYKSHLVLGRSKKLFTLSAEGVVLWSSKGFLSFSLLKQKIYGELKAFGFEEVSTRLVSQALSLDVGHLERKQLQETFISKKRGKVFEKILFDGKDTLDLSEGLFHPPFFEGVRGSVFCSEEDLFEELISYLHFMTKIFKILGFVFRPIFFEVRKGKFQKLSSLYFKALEAFSLEVEKEVHPSLDGKPSILGRAVDGLGREFALAEVSSSDEKSLIVSSCLSFERAFALMLETSKGDLPFWISPLQVKVVSLQNKHQLLAESVQSSLLEAGFRTKLIRAKEELKQILHSSLEEGVPYVVVIGDKEIEENTVTLRDIRAKKAQSLPLQDLIEMLRKVN